MNARGGVRGRRIQLVQLDDAGRAADAASNADKLLAEHDVDVLIAPTSEETLPLPSTLARCARRRSPWSVRPPGWMSSAPASPPVCAYGTRQLP